MGGVLVGRSAGLVVRWVLRSGERRWGWIGVILGELAAAAAVAFVALSTAIGGVPWPWVLVLGIDLAVVAAVLAVTGAFR